MKTLITRQNIIESLILLGKQVQNGPPQKIIQEAVKTNPWFTAYYIRQSLRNIASWLSVETFQKFETIYSYPSIEPKHIGIIAAGNVPLVGFHDVLISLLSGHIVSIKCSHQDQVLMEWILESWKKILPALNSYIRLVHKIEKADYLIATGSNNTARYLEANYGEIPKLIRKNRFSVVILDSEISDEKLMRLSDDILLHNGLGCRNVSNCLVVEGFDIDKWQNLLLQKYSFDKLNPYYIKKVAYERARLTMLGIDFIDAEIVLMVQSDTFVFGQMGILALQYVTSHEEATQRLKDSESSIQCVSGLDVSIGSTQFPDFFTFADNVDTPQILNSLI